MLDAFRLLIDALFPSRDDRWEAERARMERFLSQATDRIHLEALEREWFRYHSRMV